MSFRRIFVVFALLAVPSLALADTQGADGQVVELQVNQSTADTYLQFHGRVFLEVKRGQIEEYRWGGTSCGTRVLAPEHVSLLMQAQASGLRVAPLWQPGQGGAQCIVGLRIVP